jgi:hypothetical protein
MRTDYDLRGRGLSSRVYDRLRAEHEMLSKVRVVCFLIEQYLPCRCSWLVTNRPGSIGMLCCLNKS